MQRMTILGLTVDAVENIPMVLLKSESTGAVLPVWLGASEALHISMAQMPIHLGSPLVHECLLQCLSVLGASLLSCSVLDVQEGIFTVTIEIDVQGKMTSVPCRLADGVALALRKQVPVYAATHVLEKVAADRADPTASPDARCPADMAERLVARVLPESMQATLMAQKASNSAPSKGVATIRVPAKPDENKIESIKDKLLREMEPASRRIM